MKLNKKVCTISVESIKLMNEQIAHELRNYSIYINFSSELSLLGYVNGEKYYYLRAEEEKEHAEILIAYMNKNDAPVTIKTIEVPQYTIDGDIKKIFELTIDVEIETTELLEKIYDSACENKDRALKHWIANGLITTQYEDEESESRLALSIIEEKDTSMLIKMDKVLALLNK